MAFLQITDLHFVPLGKELFGLDPALRLAPAIDLINREHRDASFLLITGDLTNGGEEAAYRALAEVLHRCEIPVHLMLGNHDSRSPFRTVFDAPSQPDEFVQFVVHDGQTPVICLDTLIDEPDRSDGALCDARLGWLLDRISDLPGGRPWVLALHHPPMPLGMPNMDRIGLNEGEALHNVLATHPPAMMLIGHVHRPIHGVWRGVPFHIQRAVSHQVAYRPAATPTLVFQDEPPEFSIISIGKDGPVIHTRGYLSEGPAFPKS